MLEVEGFILAGGASSRMGTDKARLELDGLNFVERIESALASITTRASLVGVPVERGREWPALTVVSDVHVKWGALGGLHAALAACEAEWAAVVACDLPFVTGELFVRLASLRENFDAVVPIQADGRLQPLCALYRVSTTLTRVEELIADGERRPRAMLNLIQTRIVAFEELNDLPGADSFFLNVNTPEDYAHARKEGEK
ncbi:MAG TPA: molybdenum cofactor guanylyltransferase [Pyrinomonadaceae bacterium]|nr:molybdenum cofactor guanylyltransferase [Pyrinomonadaceae bacterium]